MAEPDRVLGAPRTNSSSISRRAALAGLAILPATLPAAASADPIFAAIDRHRKASATHLAALQEAEHLVVGWGEIIEQPCRADNLAFEALLAAPSTTLAGLVAKLAYLRTFAEGDDAWMLDEREGASLALIDSIVASLKNARVLS